MTNNHKPRIFLCHSKEDKSKVRDLYYRLVDEDFDVWFDEEKLLPGQEWDLEIRKAVRETDVVVVCLSNGSVSKTGYVQKEIRFALDIADERPDGAIFIIPARLEDCQVPIRLGKWQWVDLFPSYEKGLSKILKVLKPNNASSGNSSAKNNTDVLFHVTENVVSIVSAESQAELPSKPPASLQMVAETYLSTAFHSNSTEKQTLKQSGKVCVAPLINAIVARIIRESQNSYLGHDSTEDYKDDTIQNLSKKFNMILIIGDLIKRGYELIAEIGTEALNILHNILIIETRQDNIRLITALLLLEGEKSSQKTIEAIAIAKRKQREILDEKGVLEGGVETTLFWMFNYILFKTRTDPNFEAKFLKSLRERGFTFEEGLNSIKHEAYDLILNNLNLSKTISLI